MHISGDGLYHAQELFVVYNRGVVALSSLEAVFESSNGNNLISGNRLDGKRRSIHTWTNVRPNQGIQMSLRHAVSEQLEGTLHLQSVTEHGKSSDTTFELHTWLSSDFTPSIELRRVQRRRDRNRPWQSYAKPKTREQLLFLHKVETWAAANLEHRSDLLWYKIQGQGNPVKVAGGMDISAFARKVAQYGPTLREEDLKKAVPDPGIVHIIPGLRSANIL